MTKGPGLEVLPSWQSNGRFAYVTREGLAFGDSAVGIKGEFGRPDWTPTGSMVVFHREADRVRAAGGGVQTRRFVCCVAVTAAFVLALSYLPG